jgi:hypothetical protein
MDFLPETISLSLAHEPTLSRNGVSGKPEAVHFSPPESGR